VSSPDSTTSKRSLNSEVSARFIRSDPDSDPTLSGAVVVVESSSDSASLTAASATAASVVVGSEASVEAATSSSYLNR